MKKMLVIIALTIVMASSPSHAQLSHEEFDGIVVTSAVVIVAVAAAPAAGVLSGLLFLFMKRGAQEMVNDIH